MAIVHQKDVSGRQVFLQPCQNHSRAAFARVIGPPGPAGQLKIQITQHGRQKGIAQARCGTKKPWGLTRDVCQCGLGRRNISLHAARPIG